MKSIDIEAVRARHLRPEQMEHRTFYAGHIAIDLAACVDEVERLRGTVANLTEENKWLEKAVEVTDAARCDDRTAVVAFLHACGYDAAAEAVAKAGFPLWACLPLVSPEAIRNSGEHTP